MAINQNYNVHNWKIKIKQILFIKLLTNMYSNVYNSHNSL